MLANCKFSIAYMTRYSKAFKAALDRWESKDSDLARLLDINPANIYHWKEGIRPIPADKAVAIGDILNINPASISEAFEKIENVGKSLPVEGSSLRLISDESQPKRLDPEMIAECYATLSEIYLEERGVPYDLTIEPERFVLVYEARSRMSKNPSTAEERRFGAKVAEIVRLKGEELHGQRDGVPAEGASKGGMAGRVQRKEG